MRALAFAHRWLGIASCLLFAMWFASGMVMHVVPFPSLSETERVAGLYPFDPSTVTRSPDDAVRETGAVDVSRIRLIQRPDGPAYILKGASGLSATFADHRQRAAELSAGLALAVARRHAQSRGLDASSAAVAALDMHDQWSVPNGLDPHRPLYRIALGDSAGTELYVSSRTGEVVLDTTRRERIWNWVGSVPHWIYPTVLRRNWASWDATVWTISLLALVGAVSGAWLGMARIKWRRGLLQTPYRGWHAWHHGAGLATMLFLTTWIFSGWLSMDHGRLFSTGQPTGVESTAITGGHDWRRADVLGTTEAREVEWFALAGQIYRRARSAPDAQRLSISSREEITGGFLRAAEDVDAAIVRSGLACSGANRVPADDAYAIASSFPAAPVFRVECGTSWLHLDAASGALLERLDPSRRTYRWLYSALHTLDVPALMARPQVRSVLIVSLCSLGFAFSMTGIVLAWRRLRRMR